MPAEEDPEESDETDDYLDDIDSEELTDGDRLAPTPVSSSGSISSR